MDSSLLCKGTVKIVSLRPDSFKPRAIPEQIKQQINQGA
jgi:acyl-CoA thioesterase FadM